jgi:thiol-disulfide isomerase/thioredoxin
VAAVVLMATCSEKASQPELPDGNPAKADAAQDSGAASQPKTSDQVHLNTNEEILALFKQPDAKAVVANFWATWCGPCRAEMPELVRFFKEYTPRGVRFVSISGDDPEAPEDELIPYMEEMEIPFDVHVPRMGESVGGLVGELDPNWGGALPATVVFDPSGRIVRKWLGPVEFEDLAEAVKEFLQE